MHIIHVHVHVKSEFIDDFIKVSEENAKNSILEPGITRFDVVQQSDDPTHFVLVEVYRTPDDQSKHKETSHYKVWRDQAEPMMAEPRTREVYKNIFPPDEDW
jgi:autoinducer 2-degrading protein